MDGLSGDVFAFEVTIGNSGSDVVEMHWFFSGFEDDVDFVTDVFRVDGWPFGESPKPI